MHVSPDFIHFIQKNFVFELQLNWEHIPKQGILCSKQYISKSSNDDNSLDNESIFLIYIINFKKIIIRLNFM